MASAVTSSCPDFVPVPSLALLSTSQLRLGESSCTGLALASNWSWKKPNQSSFWRSFPLKKRPPLFSGSGQPCASALGWPHPFPPVQGGLARPSWPTANTAYPHTWLHGSSHCSWSNSARRGGEGRRTELKRDCCTHIGGWAGGPVSLRQRPGSHHLYLIFIFNPEVGEGSLKSVTF